MRGKAATAIDDALVKEMRAALAYDPETGEFRWLVSRNGNAKAKARAGSQKGGGYWHVRYRDSQGVDHRFMVHRLAYLFTTGEWPPHEIDHIDGDPSNNRWVNLRALTHGQNQFHAGLQSNNTSGKTGVCFNARRRLKPWRAYLYLDHRHIDVGHFTTYEAAVAARRAAELEHRGWLRPS